MARWRRSQPDVYYLGGLSLGQAHEPTALAVLAKTVGTPEQPDGGDVGYAVPHLERFEPGTPYATIFARVAAIFAAPPLAGTDLVVDQTGVGQPIIDMLRQSGVNADVVTVTVGAGHRSTWEPGLGRLVPRKELVGLMQILLQGRTIRVSPALPEAQLLVQELANFQAKVTVATDDPSLAWREGQHDDLVLAIAVAAWQAQRHSPDEGGRPRVFGSRAWWTQRPW